MIVNILASLIKSYGLNEGENAETCMLIHLFTPILVHLSGNPCECLVDK
jgi:hypothetical protein